MTPSAPEAHFAFLWEAAGGDPDILVPEYQFHESRKWRADFAVIDSGVLFEIEGAVHARGRHTRGAGFTADAKKYLEAMLAGWRVVRLVPAQLNLSTVTRLLTWTQQLPKRPQGTSLSSSTPPAGKTGSCPSSKTSRKKLKPA